MKRSLVVVLLFLFVLAGCAKPDNVDRAMTLRQSLLNAKGCSFDAQITADYGDKLYSFSMKCSTDAQGDLTFTVTQPQTIAGISGKITAQDGQLYFDDQVLAFSLLADGQASPVSAPWILIRTLRSGYISAGGQDEEYYQVQIDDSYADDPLHLDIWLDENNAPVSADILYDGRRILSLTVKNFTIQ